MHCRLNLELVGAIVFHGLGRDIFQRGSELVALHSANGNFHRHAHDNLPHLCLVHVTPKNQVAHVGHRRDGGTIVERVGQNDGVSHLDRHVEDKAADGGPNERAAGIGVLRRHAVTHHLQVIVGGPHLLLGLQVCLAHLVIVVASYQPFVVERFLPVVVHLGLAQHNLCRAHSRLRRAEHVHVGNDLHLGYHLSGCHHVARLFVYIGDDTRYLWFDVHLVARLNLASHHRGFAQVFHGGHKLLVGHRLRPALFPEEYECSDKNKQHQRRNDKFEIFFHHRL